VGNGATYYCTVNATSARNGTVIIQQARALQGLALASGVALESAIFFLSSRQIVEKTVYEIQCAISSDGVNPLPLVNGLDFDVKVVTTAGTIECSLLCSH
jgi:hypothetical protein